MLFGCDTGHRLEPVCVMSGTVIHSPVFHGLGYLIGDFSVKSHALLLDLHQLLEGGILKVALHN